MGAEEGWRNGWGMKERPSSYARGEREPPENSAERASGAEFPGDYRCQSTKSQKFSS